jgi:hypothetical protein
LHLIAIMSRRSMTIFIRQELPFHNHTKLRTHYVVLPCVL